MLIPCSLPSPSSQDVVRWRRRLADSYRRRREAAFHARKAARVAHFERFVKGWKQRPCGACNGSGRYDHCRPGQDHSPPCDACDGTGKETYKPTSPTGA